METQTLTRNDFDQFVYEQLRANPTDVSVGIAYTENLLVSGKYQEALKILESLLTSNHGDPRVLLAMARVCRDLGQEDSCKIFLQALRQTGANSQIAESMWQQLEKQRVSECELTSRAMTLQKEFYVLSSKMVAGAADYIDPSLAPLIIDFNGDLLRIPAQMLDYLWHTYSPKAEAIVPSFLAESWHYAWIQERLKPGEIAFDIGASFGYFSVMMSKAVGKQGVVHIFEPNPKTAEDLRKVLLLNECENTVLNEYAVSDSTGIARFTQVLAANVQRESSHLSSKARDGVSAPQGCRWIMVPTVTLDQYVIPRGIRPRLLKIDVEGADLQVLYGAKETLSLCSPDIVLEVHSSENSFFQELHAYLSSLGYSYSYQDKICFCTKAL